MKQFRWCLSLLLLLVAGTGFTQPKKHTISGQIKDGANGEDMAFANIVVAELPGTGTVSNEYGFYSITLLAGEYTLKFQVIGYETIEKKISLTDDQRLDVELSQAVYTVGGKEGVKIYGEKEDENITLNEGSVTKVDMQRVKELPAFGGEPDIMKYIVNDAGIKTAGEGNSGFYVRGGGLDQNLILLDEAPVYNPSHLLGFFSVFNGDALKGATVYKGGMPAQYGGRTASVMDIRMKDGNNKKFGVSGGIGILSGRLTVEGPIVKDKGSFIVSGRRTYADLFLPLSGNESFSDSDLFFYDFNVKGNYRINEKNRIYLSGYFGRDKFGFEDEFGINWGNATGTLRWNHLFSDKLFSNTSLIYSNYDYEFAFGVGDNRLGLQSVIEDFNLKQDFSYYLSKDNTLKFGANVIQHNIEPGNLSAGANTGITAEDAELKKGIEAAVYLQNQQDFGRLNLNYGLRFSYFNAVGPGTMFDFDDDGTLLTSTNVEDGESIEEYSGFEPRFSANYLLDEKSSLKLGYNRNYQYIHLLTNATSSNPTDVWIMSSNNVKPQIADQVSLGYFRNFKNNMFETSAEVYYKDMQNVIDYRNGADVFFNDELEGDLVSGDGEAYGIELSFKKTKGRLVGGVAYTLSRTLRQIDELNDGEKFPARQDRINDITFNGVYKLSDKVSLSGNFIFYTGDAVTYPAGRYVVDGNVVPYYTDRNAGRMPDYHRLDLGVTWYNKKTEKYESNWNFSLYNVYGRENAYSINFQPVEDNPTQTEAVQLSLFRWVPSVTYNFKF